MDLTITDPGHAHRKGDLLLTRLDMSRKRSNNLLADDGDTRVVSSITAKTADLGEGNPDSDRQHHTPRRTILLLACH